MTLTPCYRATCDAPGCEVAELLPHKRAAACRFALFQRGWTLIEHRRVSSGAPRLLYACPTHRDWRPEPAVAPDPGPLLVRDAARDGLRRRAMVWLLHGAGATYPELGAALGLSTGRAQELGEGYERTVFRRQRQAADWIEPWARRLRAEGAIP